jgi:hypothetical protein
MQALTGGSGFPFPDQIGEERRCQRGVIDIVLTKMELGDIVFDQSIAGDPAMVREYSGNSCSVIVALNSNGPIWTLLHFTGNRLELACSKIFPVLEAAINRLPPA